MKTVWFTLLSTCCLWCSLTVAEVILNIESGTAFDPEGLEVWVMIENPKSRSYPSKSAFKPKKRGFADTDGKVSIDLDVKAEDKVRISIHDPQVTPVDLTLNGSQLHSPFTIKVSPLPSNGQIRLDLSHVKRREPFKDKLVERFPHQLLFSLRLLDSQGTVHFRVAYLQGEEIELFDLPDGTYTIQQVTMSKHAGGGDGFLYPHSEADRTLNIKDGRIIEEDRVLFLKTMRP